MGQAKKVVDVHQGLARDLVHSSSGHGLLVLRRDGRSALEEGRNRLPSEGRLRVRQHGIATSLVNAFGKSRAVYLSSAATVSDRSPYPDPPCDVLGLDHRWLRDHRLEPGQHLLLPATARRSDARTDAKGACGRQPGVDCVGKSEAWISYDTADGRAMHLETKLSLILTTLR